VKDTVAGSDGAGEFPAAGAGEFDTTGAGEFDATGAGESGAAGVVVAEPVAQAASRDAQNASASRIARIFFM